MPPDPAAPPVDAVATLAAEELDLLVGIPTVRRPPPPHGGEPLLLKSVRSLLDKPLPGGLRIGILIHNLDPEPERHEAVWRLPDLARELGAGQLLRIETPSRDSVRALERDDPRHAERDRGLDAAFPLRRWQRRIACDRALLLQGMAERRAWGYLALEDDNALVARGGWRRLQRDARRQLALRGGILRLRAYSHFPRFAARHTRRSGATALLFDGPQLHWYLGAIRESLSERHGTEPIDVLLDRRRTAHDWHNLHLFRHLGGHNSTHPNKPVYQQPRSLLAEDLNVFKSALIDFLRPRAPRLANALLQLHARLFPGARLNKK